jgi:hypothetical protein
MINPTINNTINSFLTRPVAYIHQGSSPSDETDVAIVSRYRGSNGYTVSIDASAISYKIQANIISPNGGRFETAVDNICNGLERRHASVCLG